MTAQTRPAAGPRWLCLFIQKPRRDDRCGSAGGQQNFSRPKFWIVPVIHSQSDHGCQVHGMMRGMEKINRTAAGVQFESDVLLFVDQLAREQQRSRSFIINAVLRWYAKWLEEQRSKVETSKPEQVIRL